MVCNVSTQQTLKEECRKHIRLLMRNAFLMQLPSLLRPCFIRTVSPIDVFLEVPVFRYILNIIYLYFGGLNSHDAVILTLK